MIDIVTIETPSLGDRTYVATDGQVALVVDPQRDVDRILADAARRGATISLDAIHISTAQHLGSTHTSFVTYDKRLLDAARAAGLPADAPA